MLVSLWLSTRTLSLYFWQQKSPLDESNEDDTYAWFVIFQNLPLLFLSEAVACKAISNWSEFNLVYAHPLG